MKRLFFTAALPALIALLVLACSSPTDALPSRKENTPLLSPIHVEKSKDIGVLPPNAPHTFTVEIQNSSTTDSVTITDIRLKDGAQGFQLIPPALPVRLGQQGQTDRITVTVMFNSTASGTYHDKIIINGDTSLFCELTAAIIDNAITVDDIDFGTILYGNKRDIKANITNNGDEPVTVLSATMQGVVNENSIENFLHLSLLMLPIQINPGESRQFWVVFNGAYPGENNATIEFQMEYAGSGTVDNISVLTGTVER